MPWNSGDATSHTKKADSLAKQRAWARIANSVLKQCLKKGQGDCEGRAIRIANAAVANWKSK